MNGALLRRLALQTAELKTNPKSRFARLHPNARKRIVDSVYQDNMTDDELFKAISDKIMQHPMPKNPTKEAAVSQRDYEKSYDELIAPNKELEAEADKILAANPEKFTGDTEEIFDPTDLDYMYDEDLIPNIIVEKINAQRARDFDARYRKAYAIYDRQHYQPTMGRVKHIWRKGYKPQPDRSSGRKLPFNERMEDEGLPNFEDAYYPGEDQFIPEEEGILMRIGRGPYKRIY
jgi:hypothetical protein